MQTIVLFGAGKSATVLIEYLLAEAQPQNWQVMIADSSKKLVEEKTKRHPRSIAIELDATNNASRRLLIEKSSLVISMMPPHLHKLIAQDCLEFGRHLLTASYVDTEIKKMNRAATEKGLLFLCEMGLDPGIDHMSAMKLFNEIKDKGGKIVGFKSHCGGLVAPESDDNPWHYKVSWNPRNIVMAGSAGAVYKENGTIKKEGYKELFDVTRGVDTGHEEIGFLCWYPNRDSLTYIDVYELDDAKTFIRTTLRHPDFMYGWKNVLDLNLTDETPVYHTDGMTLKDFFQQHMEKNGFGEWVGKKLTENLSQTKDMLQNLLNLLEAEEAAIDAGESVEDEFMMVTEKGELQNVNLDSEKNNTAAALSAQTHHANLTLKQLFYLGMDDDETVINKGTCSAADVMQLALEKKLALNRNDKDLVVMIHEIDYELNGSQHKVFSKLIVKGENNLHTAMAKTVGLPLGIAAKLILNGSIKQRGVQIPVSRDIYEQVLPELASFGIYFEDKHS